MEDIVREPVVLIDEDLDAVAGGHHGGVKVSDVNIADIDQLISQTIIGGSGNSQTAAQIATVSQSS